MKISVLLFAVLRERAGAGQLSLDDLPGGGSVADLKRELEQRHPELGSLEHVRAVVNEAYVQEDAVLPDGCTVALIPPVSGGNSDQNFEAGVFELSADALDPMACQRRVSHDSCGAAVLFTGMTRDKNRGKSVTRLTYEAFAEMVGPEMGRIFERCLEQFPKDAEHRVRMLCQHRTGVVEIGEPSVIVAVASPHRDTAFVAARFLIDELKKSLPVWKKEFYPDGEHWIGQGA